MTSYDYPNSVSDDYYVIDNSGKKSKIIGRLPSYEAAMKLVNATQNSFDVFKCNCDIKNGCLALTCEFCTAEGPESCGWADKT